MKKLGKRVIQFISIVSLASVLSCELSEQVFIQPVPIALEASNISATSFRAHWKPLLGASQYLIDVSTTSNFAESDILPGYPQAISDTSIMVTELDVNQIYFYRIRATRQGTLTPNSEEITVQTSSLLSPLATEATTVTSAGFRANWEPTDGAIEYNLQLSNNMQFESVLSFITTTDTFYVFDDLEPEQRYYYRVRATDGSSVSGFSNIIDTATAKVQTPLPLPALGVSPIKFTAVWNQVEGANFYELEIAEDPDFTKPLYNNAEPLIVNDTTQEVRLYSVRIGKTHYYRVRARSNFSISEYSETIAVDTRTIQNCRLSRIFNDAGTRTAPEVLFDYDDDHLLSIEWRGNTSGAIYRLEYNDQDQVTGAVISNVIPFFGELVTERWEFVYNGSEVVSEINITNNNGDFIIKNIFEYNDSLQVTRFAQEDDLGGGIIVTDLNFTYSDGSWTPSAGSDAFSSGQFNWTYDENISPYVLFDPNLALLMPTVPASQFVTSSEPHDERRFPFLGVTNLTLFASTNSGNTIFGYLFDSNQAVEPPTERIGDDISKETYTYRTDCN